MDKIDQRVRNGDTAAMLEEASLSPEVVVPTLIITAQNKSTDPTRAELACKTLSRVHGVEDYLKGRIDAQSRKQTLEGAEERANELDNLSLVRTNKAIRVIASYLFDDKDVGYTGSDYTIVSVKVGATVILDDLHLPGAPSNDFRDIQRHIAAWRTWWLKNQTKFGDTNPYQGTGGQTGTTK